MWLKMLFRLLKKRAVLGVIFTLSFLYFISFLVNEGGLDVDGNDDVSGLSIPVKSFEWHKEEKNHSGSLNSCRNSVQGKALVADDRGYVCQRLEVEPSGCCRMEASSTKRYVCDTCLPHGCCSIYEYCISCCMHPNKKAVLQKTIGQASETFKVLFASITDHFELCLTKCRTSSQSVQHENSYRDPKAKHCYTEGISHPNHPSKNTNSTA
ncbi:SREBP regulating gene protein-like [Ornithodoros turicata]|uniref:SREBP regulating gene protein n=1 Tax=Ornithodoros turicata TaxID=34597 RepID=A0A2R5LJR4_9ACAR